MFAPVDEVHFLDGIAVYGAVLLWPRSSMRFPQGAVPESRRVLLDFRLGMMEHDALLRRLRGDIVQLLAVETSDPRSLPPSPRYAARWKLERAVRRFLQRSMSRPLVRFT